MNGTSTHPGPTRTDKSSSHTSDAESLPGASNTDPSVIVGLACRFPGAKNVSELWDVLAQKKDLLQKIPSDRFNVDAFYHPISANKGTVCLHLSDDVLILSY